MKSSKKKTKDTPPKKTTYSIEESRINFLFFSSFVLFLVISIFLLLLTSMYKDKFTPSIFEPIGILLLGVSICGVLTIMFANYMKSHGQLETHGAYIKGALAMFIILFFAIGSSYVLLTEDKKNRENEINKMVKSEVEKKINENHEKVIKQLAEVIPELRKIGNLYFVTQCSKLQTDKITYESASFKKYNDDVTITDKGTQAKADTKLNNDILISAKSVLDSNSVLFEIIYKATENLVIIKFDDIEELLNICKKQKNAPKEVIQNITPNH